jgi:hypothetical protein
LGVQQWLLLLMLVGWLGGSPVQAAHATTQQHSSSSSSTVGQHLHQHQHPAQQWLLVLVLLQVQQLTSKQVGLVPLAV